VPGPDHLREALTNCTDPLAAIEEFQAIITVLCVYTDDPATCHLVTRPTTAAAPPSNRKFAIPRLSPLVSSVHCDESFIK